MCTTNNNVNYNINNNVNIWTSGSINLIRRLLYKTKDVNCGSKEYTNFKFKILRFENIAFSNFYSIELYVINNKIIN